MLVNRNITVGDLRTSVRLEPQFWTALTDIAARERLSVDQLCTVIDGHLGELGRTAGIRVFIASYFAAQKDVRDRAAFENTVAAARRYTPAESLPRRAFG